MPAGLLADGDRQEEGVRITPAHVLERRVVAFADPGPAAEDGCSAGLVGTEERAPHHGGEREGTQEHRGEDVGRAQAPLEVPRERRQGVDAAVLVLDDQHQHPARDRHLEEDVEVVAVGDPGAVRPQDRVVEVVEPPQQEGARHDPGPARPGPVPVHREDDTGDERDEAEEDDARDRRDEEVPRVVDGVPRPDHRHRDDQVVGAAPLRLPREDHGRPQQQQRRPPGGDLVDEQPVVVARDDEQRDGAEARHVQPPRRRPDAEVPLAVGDREDEEEPADGEGDRRLEDAERHLEGPAERQRHHDWSIAPATWSAMAMIVIIGLTPLEAGKVLASAT